MLAKALEAVLLRCHRCTACCSSLAVSLISRDAPQADNHSGLLRRTRLREEDIQILSLAVESAAFSFTILVKATVLTHLLHVFQPAVRPD